MVEFKGTLKLLIFSFEARTMDKNHKRCKFTVWHLEQFNSLTGCVSCITWLYLVTFYDVWADCWLYWHSLNKVKPPAYTGHMRLTYIQSPSFVTWIMTYTQCVIACRRHDCVRAGFLKLVYENWMRFVTEKDLVPRTESKIILTLGIPYLLE